MANYKLTQRDLNPFPYSDSNKRYYTWDYYLRQKYGGKVFKVGLDAGFSCPNIDGARGGAAAPTAPTLSGGSRRRTFYPVPPGTGDPPP